MTSGVTESSAPEQSGQVNTTLTERLVQTEPVDQATPMSAAIADEATKAVFPQDGEVLRV